MKRIALRTAVVILGWFIVFEVGSLVSPHRSESFGQTLVASRWLLLLVGLVWACWPPLAHRRAGAFASLVLVPLLFLAVYTLGCLYGPHLRLKLGQYREPDVVTQQRGLHDAARQALDPHRWW